MTTYEMKFGDIGFIIDRLGADCAPYQYVRELTQNGIEAILKTGRKDGLIEWGFDSGCFERIGVKKLCVTDNGIAMGAPELHKYIATLSSSGGVQSMTANYGVGARISTLPTNPSGVEYYSWTASDSVGHYLRLWRDPKTEEYGLSDVVDDDGNSLGHIVALPLDYPRPAGLQEHGTRVVLHGFDETSDTFSHQKSGVVDTRRSVPTAGRWLQKYLNTRYFKFPESVRVICRESKLSEQSGSRSGEFRRATGQGPMLDAIALAKGVQDITDARVHWWIIPDPDPDTVIDPPANIGGGREGIGRMKTLHPHYCAKGHVAVLYQNELYDFLEGHRGGRAMLQQFGISLGYDRVVLYVEPTGENMTTDTARTHVRIAGEDAPWALWAEQFRDSLPPELRAFIEKQKPQISSVQAWRERLRAHLDLFYRAAFHKRDNGTKKGTITNTKEGRPRGDDVHNPDDTPERPHRKFKPPVGGRGTLDVGRLHGPTQGVEVRRTDLPDVMWVSADKNWIAKDPAERFERPEDEHANEAGWFVQPNTIKANWDFVVYQRIVDEFVKDFPATPGAEEIIGQIVRDWYSQILVETIYGLRALVSEGHWSAIKLHDVLNGIAIGVDRSGETLTAAVMQRILIANQIKRAVYTKLHKPTVQAAE